ncbi:membrane protein insertion efficiency factor YidD [Thermospira aquatica]|uniref:Putative membrane protein insertion efficiency factor n=2 Tax=Thermospira aquatica TaxID=2828656 RepID=A0AAX3BH91_9SPIR|nr:membrane protein insertion efficiency factor YidD [Thermospira aquatica]
MRFILMALVRFYKKYISLHLPSSCIYHPSCSSYALEALRRHGAFKGSVLALLRILRCQGWFFAGGNDPVPRAFSWRRIMSRYMFFWKWRKK